MKTIILNSLQIEQKINRIAHEIYENNFEEKEIVIAGIASRGFLLAKRITDVLTKISPIKVKVIELYIDKENPLKSTEANINEKEVSGKVVLLVDDVLNSGKTLIYGAKLFLDFPIKRLTTVVLVDRNHTRYPIKADFVGLSLATTLQEHISVEIENKGKEVAYLI